MFGVTGLRARLLEQARPKHAGIIHALWSLNWLAGHAAGGALFGGLLGWAGVLLLSGAQRPTTAILGVSCWVWGAAELGLIRLPMPQLPRQVARRWMMRLPWSLVAWGYGLQLGSAVATRITMHTTYAVLGFSLLSGSAVAGATILAVFGASRSLATLVLGRRVAGPEKALACAVAIDGYEGVVRNANALYLILVGAVVVAGGQ